MGALHEGHLTLIREARKTGLPVLVSIFVNPTQFGPSEDFSRYPRNLERDCHLAEGAGADAVFAPEVEEIYRSRPTRVEVPEVTELYEGSVRPGHFSGVATIVLKLFHIALCKVAFFGLKDLQQCAVIARMVSDLDLKLDLRFVPTLREPDGLALSSRNVYLDEKNRAIAPLLYRTLCDTKSHLLAGQNVDEAIRLAIERLSLAGFQPDYLDLISRSSFHPTRLLGEDCAIIAAAKLGNTHLIDNVLVFSDANMP